MKKSYKILTTETGKPTGASGNEENYEIFNRKESACSTLDEVKTELEDKYGKCKKVFIYQDDEKGNAIKTGRIYCFKNSDVSHNSKPWYQQDWVEVKEIISKPLIKIEKTILV